ncbi:MAG: dockerin type I repeat-containing protein [Chthoniobacterales bacterium]
MPGVECRSGGGDHALIVTFNNPIVSGSASVGSGTGTVSGSPTFFGNTMTVNLTGVTDSFGQSLSPAAITFTTLIGDVNGNRSVNSNDVAQVKALTNAPLNGSNFRADVNANGNINATDVALVKASTNHTIP